MGVLFRMLIADSSSCKCRLQRPPSRLVLPPFCLARPPFRLVSRPSSYPSRPSSSISGDQWRLSVAHGVCGSLAEALLQQLHEARDGVPTVVYMVYIGCLEVYV